MAGNCYICDDVTNDTCSNCNKPFCSSCSGVGMGVSEASDTCKKCTQRLYKTRCTKCGNRFKSQEELEAHFEKHPVHKTQYD